MKDINTDEEVDNYFAAADEYKDKEEGEDNSGEEWKDGSRDEDWWRKE